MNRGEKKMSVKNNIKQIPGAKVNMDKNAVYIPFKAEEGKEPGRLFSYILAPGLLLHDIVIHSTTIPDFTVLGEKKRMLKINICTKGRCELKLHNNEYTYLSGGEVAIDTGQAEEAYYYPEAEYEGIEIVICMDEQWKKEIKLAEEIFDEPDLLYDKCSQRCFPQIDVISDDIEKLVKDIQECTIKDKDRKIVFIKMLEIIYQLKALNLEYSHRKRDYYTASQVKIAKEVKSLILEDLSIRYTANELAKKYAISETTLKNYFRGVYGCGYSQFQKEERMKLAGRLLSQSNKSVLDIANAVGYISQGKFNAVFKDFYCVTPLEYRRSSHLERKE